MDEDNDFLPVARGASALPRLQPPTTVELQPLGQTGGLQSDLPQPRQPTQNQTGRSEPTPGLSPRDDISSPRRTQPAEEDEDPLLEETSIKLGGFLGLRAANPDKSVLGSNLRLTIDASGVSGSYDARTIGTGDKNDLQEMDGIYLTKADQELNSDNIRRLEQRLLNAKEFQYFRSDNRELKIDSKLFDTKLFRQTDISIVKNPYHSFIKRNAVICERLNQKKKTFYMMDMFVGKLIIDKHPIFDEEDRLASKLKSQMRAYRDKVDKSLIPHYRQVLQEQSEESDKLRNDAKTSASDLALIHKQIEDTKSKIEREKVEMGDCMLDVYQTWRSIKNIRESKSFASTNVDLVVQEYRNDQDKIEQFLVLKEMIISEKVGPTGRTIPGAEQSRRSKLKDQTYFLKIYINNMLMATTPKVQVQWPAFEVEFKELFNIFVYTKPYSIAIEVCTGGVLNTVLDRIELDIPGELANSLTSASTISREVKYAKKKILKLPKTKKKDPANIPLPPTPGGGTPPPGSSQIQQPNDLSAGDLVNQDGNKDKNNMSMNRDDDAKTDVPSETDTEEIEAITEVLESGRISIEVGWKGFGPQLPPLNTGGFGIFRQRKKDRHGYNALPQSEDELLKDEVLIDVNDPRNNEMVEKVREIRNNYLRSLLRNDMKIPLYDVPSLRQQVMRMNMIENDKNLQRLPLLEEEVASDEKLLKLLRNHYEEKSKFFRENRGAISDTINLKNVTNVEAFPQSPVAQKRINDTRLTFMAKQNDIKLKKNLGLSDTVSVQQVVKEFRFGDEENNFIKNLMKIFEPNRKLRPKYTKPKKYGASTYNQCTIGVQAIKGINIPARWKSRAAAANQSNNFRPETLRDANLTGSLIRNADMLSPDIPDVPALPDDKASEATENYLITSSQYTMSSSFVQTSIVEPKGHQDDKTRRSGTFDGVDPEWNENLSLVYKSRSKGFTNIELLATDASLYVTVFDFLGTYEKHKENAQTLTLQVENRFLGNLKIPLKALFMNPKIDAMFKLNRPIFLFGYLTARPSSFAKIQAENKQLVDPFLPTYVMLSLTCEPNFELPEANDFDYQPGFEPTQFLLAGKGFLETFFKVEANHGRHLKLWGFNINGKSVFIPRYIHEIQPPADFYLRDQNPGANLGNSQLGNSSPPLVVDKEDDLYQKCARYVSLIPVKNDSGFFRDSPDVFMTCQEFIDMLAGDFEEHAILLCNYFLYIDHKIKNLPHIESMIVMGRGVPEGKTFYVLRRDTKENTNELWNPVTGDVYMFSQRKLVTKFLCFNVNAGYTQESGSKLKYNKAIDTICPLKFVDAVATNDNIYINLQQDKGVAATNWDITNKKMWQPFLT